MVSPLFSLGLAFPAESEDLERELVQTVSFRLPDSEDGLLDARLGEFLDPAAGQADEMAVGGLVPFRLKMTVTFTQVDGRDQAAADQQVQGPVNRGQADLSFFGPKPPADLIGVGMNAGSRQAGSESPGSPGFFVCPRSS